MRSSFCLCILLLAAGCAQAPSEWYTWEQRRKAPAAVDLAHDNIVIPLLRAKDGQMYVEVHAGKADLLLNVDTGYPQLHLDTSFAEENKITLTTSRYGGDFSAGHFPFTVGIVPELQLGSASVREVSAIFSDLSTWRIEQQRSVGRPIDGVLGGAVLTALDVRIDLASNRLMLRPSDVLANGIAVPLVRRDYGRLYVQARVGDEDLFLLLDTGSNGTVLDLAVARRQRVELLGGRGTMTFINGSQFATVAGRLPELRLGRASANGLLIHFMDLSVWQRDEAKVAGRRVDGILGMDILLAWGAIVDYRSQRLVTSSTNVRSLR